MTRFFKKNVVLAGLLAAAPVVFFFQNCSQSGSLGLTSTSAIGAKATTDTLEATPSPTADIVLDRIPVTPEDVGLTGSGAGQGDTNLNNKGSIGNCNQSEVSDILLKIISLSTNTENDNEASLEIIDADKSVSLEKPTLKVRAKNSATLSHLFLLLDVTGNKILNRDSSVVDFKAPSGQQSGIKIQLDSTAVLAGQIYILTLDLNPSEQIVTNKSKCLFKPVIKSANLTVSN